MRHTDVSLSTLCRRLLCIILVALAGAAAVAFGRGGVEEDFSFDRVERIVVSGTNFTVSVAGERDAEIRTSDSTSQGDGSRGHGFRTTVEFIRPATSSASIEAVESDGTLGVRVKGLPGSLRARAGEHRIEIRVTGALRSEMPALQVLTESGTVNIRDWRGDIRVSSDSGSVVIERVEGSVISHSRTGSQRIVRCTGALEFVSDTGTLTLQKVRGSLHTETDTGSLRGMGIVLTDDSVMVATTGSIDVELRNDPEELRFDLESTVGRIRVLGEDVGRRYAGGVGDIRLYCRTETGSQVIRTVP